MTSCCIKIKVLKYILLIIGLGFGFVSGCLIFLAYNKIRNGYVYK